MFAVPLLLTLAAAQPANPIVPLWDGKAPHAVGDSDTDKPSLKVFKAEAGCRIECDGKPSPIERVERGRFVTVQYRIVAGQYVAERIATLPPSGGGGRR